MRTVVLVACIFAGCSGPPAHAGLALAGATVIDVRNGSRIADATIVIERGRITTVGPGRDIRIPSGARIADVRGKYVIPGLWDLHTHIMNRRELKVFFPLLVAHGIVGIRDAGGEVGHEGLRPQDFRDLGKRHPYRPDVVTCGPTWVDGPAPAGTDDGAIVDALAQQGARQGGLHALP